MHVKSKKKSPEERARYIFFLKPSSITISHTTSEVFNVYSSAEEELWRVGTRSRKDMEAGWSCINIRSNRGNITPKLISTLRGISACFLYLHVCGPGRVYVLLNVKNCLYGTITNQEWIRRKYRNSSCSVDHFQTGGRQLKGDSKLLPWFHRDKTWVFLQKRHPCMQTVSEWEKQTQIGQMWHDASTHPPWRRLLFLLKQPECIF